MMPIRESIHALEPSAVPPFTVARRFSSPDQLLMFERGRLGAIAMGDAMLARAVLDPGWHWMAERGRVRGTQPLVGFVLAGRLALRTASGRAFDVLAGDVFHTSLERGLAARVVGYRPADVLYINGTEALVRSLRT